jgi:hypothetical protein
MRHVKLIRLLRLFGAYPLFLPPIRNVTALPLPPLGAGSVARPSSLYYILDKISYSPFRNSGYVLFNLKYISHNYDFMRPLSIIRNQIIISSPLGKSV